MNPFKWAKQQVEKFLGGVEKGNTPAARPTHETRGMARKVAKARAVKGPRPLPLGAKWFWVSVKYFWKRDGVTNERRLMTQTATYNVGRNKAKRKAREESAMVRRQLVYKRARFRDAATEFGTAFLAILDDPHVAQIS